MKGVGARVNTSFNLSICDVHPKYIKRILLANPKLEDLKVLVRDLVPVYICCKFWDGLLGNTANSEDNNENLDEKEHEDEPDD